MNGCCIDRKMNGCRIDRKMNGRRIDRRMNGRRNERKMINFDRTFTDIFNCLPLKQIFSLEVIFDFIAIILEFLT